MYRYMLIFTTIASCMFANHNEPPRKKRKVYGFPRPAQHTSEEDAVRPLLENRQMLYDRLTHFWSRTFTIRQQAYVAMYLAQHDSELLEALIQQRLISPDETAYDYPLMAHARNAEHYDGRNSIKVLIRHGVSRLPHDASEYKLDNQESILQYALRKENYNAVVQFLFEENSNDWMIQAFITNMGNSPEHLWTPLNQNNAACILKYTTRHMPQVLATLLEQEYIKPDTLCDGNPLIAYACEANTPDSVTILIDYGASNIPPQCAQYQVADNMPILKYAVKAHNFQAAWKLILYGAETKDSENNSIMHWATAYADSIIINFCLHHFKHLIKQSNTYGTRPFDILQNWNTNTTYDEKDDTQEEQHASVLLEWLQHAIKTNDTEIQNTVLPNIHPNYFLTATENGITIPSILAEHGNPTMIQAVRRHIESKDGASWEGIMSEENISTVENTPAYAKLQRIQTYVETTLHRIARTNNRKAQMAVQHLLNTNADADLLSKTDDYNNTPLENAVLANCNSTLSNILCKANAHPDLTEPLRLACKKERIRCLYKTVLLGTTDNVSTKIADCIDSKTDPQIRRFYHALKCIDNGHDIPQENYTSVSILPLCAYAIRQDDAHNAGKLAREIPNYNPRGIHKLAKLQTYITHPEVSENIEHLTYVTYAHTGIPQLR